jgi:hypothetical protein
MEATNYISDRLRVIFEELKGTELYKKHDTSGPSLDAFNEVLHQSACKTEGERAVRDFVQYLLAQNKKFHYHLLNSDLRHLALYSKGAPLANFLNLHNVVRIYQQRDGSLRASLAEIVSPGVPPPALHVRIESRAHTEENVRADNSQMRSSGSKGMPGILKSPPKSPLKYIPPLNEDCLDFSEVIAKLGDLDLKPW